MNTKHIPPFSFPKTARTVFVMTICEEILGISPIPKILDCRSHLLQAKAYLSSLRWAAGLPSAAGTARSTHLLHNLQKNTQSYQNTGRLYIQTLELDFRRKKCSFLNWMALFTSAWLLSIPAISHEISSRIFTGKQIALKKDHAWGFFGKGYCCLLFFKYFLVYW